jgi:hypothetical protein
MSVTMTLPPPYDQLDVVILPRIERGNIADLVEYAVHAGAEKTTLANLLEGVLVLALSPFDERGEDVDLAALGQRERLLDDVGRGLALDGLPALRAVRRAEPCVEQAEMVVDLGERGERAARPRRTGLLRHA